MILNIRTKDEYKTYLAQLERFITLFENSQYYGFDEGKFKDALNNPVVFVSDSCDGAEYGIIAGEFYSYNTILFVNNKLKKQSKELPIWHSSLGGLRYFKSEVSGKDFRFINDIDNLPESILEGAVVETDNWHEPLEESELSPLPPAIEELIDTVVECNKDNEG